MIISKNERNGLKLDGVNSLILNRQPSTAIEISEGVENIDVVNFTIIGYETKRSAIVSLMPFLGYGKYTTKLIKAILWFF